LVEELTKIFELFDQATEVFSGKKYPTLSVIYLVIKVLKSEFNLDLFIEPDIDEYDIIQVKQEIHNSLQKYWGIPNNAGLLAILLDLRLKTICPWPNHIQEKTIRLCCEELDTIVNNRPLSTASPPATTSLTNQYFASIFQDNYSNSDFTDNELDRYMDIKRVLVALPDKSPLEW
ncbi:16247_t:CDS:2, partial [Racocetra persica]